MASETAVAHTGTRSPGRLRWLWWTLAGVVSLLIVAAVVILLWSGATLTGDATALAHVSVQPFGGSIEHVQAFGPGGKPIPISVQGGRLTPLRHLKPGEQVSVDVRVRRPGWLGWALGRDTTEHLTLHTPQARVSERWMTVRRGSDVRVAFDQPVRAVAFGGSSGAHVHELAGARSAVSLGPSAATGTVEIAAAPRTWESVGPPTQVSWFPPSHSAVMVSLPQVGTDIGPASTLYLTFSKPVDDVLGSRRPHLSPSTPGHWRLANSHTLAFTPSGLGAAFGTHLHAQLPRPVTVTGGSGGTLHKTSQVEWTVPPGSTLRLQQLLAQEGYLPLVWHPSGAGVSHTAAAEAQAAVKAPSGTFSWRYWRHTTSASAAVERRKRKHDHARRADEVRG